MVTKHVPSDVWKTKNVIFRLTQQKTGTTPDLFTYTRKISIYYTESPVFCQLKIYLLSSLENGFLLIYEIVSGQRCSWTKKKRFWYDVQRKTKQRWYPLAKKIWYSIKIPYQVYLVLMRTVNVPFKVTLLFPVTIVIFQKPSHNGFDISPAHFRLPQTRETPTSCLQSTNWVQIQNICKLCLGVLKKNLQSTP